MTSANFSSCVNHAAEVELRERVGLQDLRPQILMFDGFTTKDAAEANPGDYRLTDVAKTLLYLEAGIDGVEKVFGADSTSCTYFAFDQQDSDTSAPLQNKNFWKISTVRNKDTRMWEFAKCIEIAVWAQVKMKREIDLDEDSESWILEDESARPIAEVVFSIDDQSICTPTACSLLPSVINSIDASQIDAVSRTMVMILLHEIAAIKDGNRPKVPAVSNHLKTCKSPRKHKPRMKKQVDD